MTKKFGTKALRALAISAAAFGMTASANAAYVFDFTGSNSSGSIGNTRIFTGVGEGVDLGKTISVSVTAWAIPSNNSVVQGAVGRWDYGLGAASSNNDDNHAVDNSGSKDFLIFQFDNAVEVTFAEFEDFGNGTDAQVGVGNLASVNTLAGKSKNGVLGLFSKANAEPANGGWVSSGPNSDSDRDINSLNVSGKTWMIGAAFDQSNDGFKLESLTVKTVGAIPEPTTWAMMIAGFGFVGGSMRRRNTASTAAQTA